MTDLAALDSYLSSDNSPEACMQLSDLDGFLTGVICSPDLLPPSEWLPIAMGTSDVAASPEIIELVLERYNEIVAGLNSDPPVLEPIFWQAKEGHVIAMDWCEGFMQAWALQRDAWVELLRSQEGQELMFPILAHLFDEQGNSVVGVSEEETDALLDAAAEKIPETVPMIYRFWKARRTPTAPH